MNYDTLLKVKNNSDDTPYIFSWNRQSFAVRPGNVALVPFDAVVAQMGDPRSGPEAQSITPEGGGVATVIPSRKDEILRLNVLYGIYGEGVDDPSYLESNDGATLRDRIPNVTVTNVDDVDGEPIVFPCDDPMCSRFTPEDGDQTQVALMTRQIEALRKKQLLMEQMLAAANGNPTVDQSPEAEVTEDTPERSRKIG